MTLIHLIVIAVLQGITEFLPISSSGHLALAPKLMYWPDQGLQIDVAVHVGTLGAVITYLWRDVSLMMISLTRLSMWRRDPGIRLIMMLVIATAPCLLYTSPSPRD